MASPDWSAPTVITPVPVIVSMSPETIAEPETTLKVTGNPEVAVARRVMGWLL